MKKFVLAACLALGGCAGSQTGARDTLEAMGFKSIELIGGYSIVDCGTNTFGTEFHAISREGKPVKGSVCEGMLGQKNVVFR